MKTKKKWRSYRILAKRVLFGGYLMERQNSFAALVSPRVPRPASSPLTGGLPFAVLRAALVSASGNHPPGGCDSGDGGRVGR